MPDTVTVLSTDFREMLKDIPDASTHLAIADWPFFKGELNPKVLKMYHDGVKEAMRILTPDGNFISVHYPKNQVKIAVEADKYGLQLRDQIEIPTIKMVKRKDECARAHISVWVYSKSDTRIFRGSQEYGQFYNRPDLNSDIWTAIFKNGFWSKDYEIQVPEAMPRKVVSQLLDMYQGPKVVDYFGGSGNFPIECLERGLDCTAAELNSNHFQLINQRLADTAQTFIDKAIESYTTTGGITWQRVEKKDNAKVRKQGT